MSGSGSSGGVGQTPQAAPTPWQGVSQQAGQNTVQATPGSAPPPVPGITPGTAPQAPYHAPTAPMSGFSPQGPPPMQMPIMGGNGQPPQPFPPPSGGVPQSPAGVPPIQSDPIARPGMEGEYPANYWNPGHPGYPQLHNPPPPSAYPQPAPPPSSPPSPPSMPWGGFGQPQMLGW